MRSWLLIPLLSTVSSPALAADKQTTPASTSMPGAANSEEEQQPIISGNEIVVTSKRIPGEVVAPQAPIQTLDEEDVASYGADSISDLISALAPQTGSGRGRGSGTPVILVNGQRISSFRELRNIPPEAIRRLQILPEEVALRYGYAPDQRVVNIILKDKFSAVTASGEFNAPTSGGYNNYELESGLFRIAGPRRYNVSAKIDNTSMLTESARDIIQTAGSEPTVAGDPDPAKYRSLAPLDHTFTLEGTMTQGLGKDGFGGSLTANGTYTHETTTSLFGLDTVTLKNPAGDSEIRTLDDPLERRMISDQGQVGLGLNKWLGNWMFSATSDNSYITADTYTDRKRNTQSLIDAAAAGTLDIAGALPDVPGRGVDHALNHTFTTSNLATLNGTPFHMPAGDASLTVKAGYNFSQSMSEASNSSFGALTLRRGDVSGGANLSLPLTSRGDFLGAIGDISLNLSGGIDHLSDFGTLTNWNTGMTWSPTSTLTFSASYIVADAAPSLSQLGAVQTVTNNVSVYDYRKAVTALVSVTSGGNPDLLKERQRDIKISGTWQLPFLDRSNLLVEYFRNRSSNVSESFPTLTNAVEAAFPDRVTRDADGNLLAIDQRPVTFDEVASSSLRWGINLSGKIGKQDESGGFGGMRGGRRAGQGGRRPDSSDDRADSGSAAGKSDRGTAQSGGKAEDRQGNRADQSSGGHGGPSSGGFGGRRGRASRWNVSIYHTWRFTDTAKIAEGVPILNQLAGDSATAGGVPRHEITGEGGMFLDGIGFRLKGTWDAPARVNSDGVSSSSNLRFGSTFNLDLRTFIDLSQQQGLVKRMPFLKGARVSFVVDNILDSRQRVTDGTGAVPLAYQAAYRTPLGRVIGIDIRKML